MEQSSTPRILRKEIPPKMRGAKGYLKAREYLRRDFNNRCAYCMTHEYEAGGPESFCINHFQPRSKGGEINHYDNLYWACRICNHIKRDHWPTPEERQRGFRFADPCQEQDYGVHFVENMQGELISLTSCGEYHIGQLRLNRDFLKQHRQERNDLILLMAETLAQIQNLEQSIQTVRVVETTLLYSRYLKTWRDQLALSIPLIPLPLGTTD